MKIGIVSTTVAIASCLASSTEARIGTSRHLFDKNAIEESLIHPTVTGVRGSAKIDLADVITSSSSISSETDDVSSKEQQFSDVQDSTTDEEDQNDSKPLASFDQVMHEDAPKHGKYVEGRAGHMDSFCARHNHFGPDCQQHHASLRGSRGENEKIALSRDSGVSSTSYLQGNLGEAKRQHESRSKTGQRAQSRGAK